MDVETVLRVLRNNFARASGSHNLDRSVLLVAFDEAVSDTLNYFKEEAIKERDAAENIRVTCVTMRDTFANERRNATTNDT